MTGSEESIIEPLEGQSVGESASITNQDDVLAQRIFCALGNISSKWLLVRTAHISQYLAKHLGRGHIVAEALHVVAFVGETVVVALTVET